MGKTSAVKVNALVDRLANQHATEMVRVGAVNRAKYNPRRMPELEMKKLENSFIRFGFVEPLVIRREDMLLIGGHQRLEAYTRILRKKKRDVAIEMVPARLIDGLSDDECKILNLALNKIHGEWDFILLADVLRSIDMKSIDIELSGFTLPEIDDIGALMADFVVEEDVDPDEALRRKGRLFSFEVETDAQAKSCKAALVRFGMSAPKFGPGAFVALCKASAKAPVPKELPAAPKKAKPRKRRVEARA